MTMEYEILIKKITEKFPGAVLGSENRFGTMELNIERGRITEIVSALRDEPEFGFDMLVDLVSIDYSAIPDRSGDRFGLAYLLKSLDKGMRLQLKVMVPEKDPVVPTVSHLYANANWLEREAYDQMGIRFKGHSNLKRILNHHEFVGHPLRKDYPITRRQWLTANQSLMDEMRKRLKEKGYVS
jgi:NADH-quinone oxidoreductase subunit C